MEQGKLAEAAKVLTRCMALACGDDGRALLGYVYAVTGRRVEALHIVDTLSARSKGGNEGSGIACGIAQVHAGLGEREHALDWLERGVETGAFMLYLGIDPTLRSLHAEPRFGALLKQVRWPE